MNVETKHFNDVHTHASAIPGWVQTYDQLGRGALSSTLNMASTGAFQMFQEVLNRQVVQRGRCPEGRFCLAVAEQEHFFGHTRGKGLTSSPVVVLLRDHEEFMLHTPDESTLWAANLSLEHFQELADLHLSIPQNDIVRRASRVAVSSDTAAQLRTALNGVMKISRSAGQRESAQLVLDKIVDELMTNTFLDVFSGLSSCSSASRQSSSVSRYIVRRCRDLLEDRICSPLSILDLCGALRVSRRSLQASFQRETGMSPLEYLRNLRLNAVRRRLITTSAAEVQIGDVASEMGFFHLSHFSRHYKELFGELPSETRRADGYKRKPTVDGYALA